MNGAHSGSNTSSRDPLQVKLQLENDLREAESRLETRTRKLQERLRQISQYQNSLQSASSPAPTSPVQPAQEIHYHHHYAPDAATPSSASSSGLSSPRSMEENYDHPSTPLTNGRSPAALEAPSSRHERNDSEEILSRQRYQLLLDEERTTATSAKRKVKQLESDLLQTKKRLQQEMTAAAQKDQRLADLQRKFPTLLGELERTEARCKQLTLDKEELYQQVQALRRELQQVKEEAHAARKSEGKAKSAREQSHQKLLNEVFALNTRLTESVLLVSELRSKRERDQELLLREASRQAQLEQTVASLEKENKELRAQLEQRSAVTFHGARDESERRYFQQEIDFLRAQILRLQDTRLNPLSPSSSASLFSSSSRRSMGKDEESFFEDEDEQELPKPLEVSDEEEEEESIAESQESPSVIKAREEAERIEREKREQEEAEQQQREKQERERKQREEEEARQREQDTVRASPQASGTQEDNEEEEDDEEYVNSSTLRKHLYRPVKNDTTDMVMAKTIRSKLVDGLELLPPNFHRITAGVYQFGTRKIHISLQNNQPVVRVGGGYMIFPAFVKKYGRSECIKIRKLPSYASPSLTDDAATREALHRNSRNSPF